MLLVAKKKSDTDLNLSFGMSESLFKTKHKFQVHDMMIRNGFVMN